MRLTKFSYKKPKAVPPTRKLIRVNLESVPCKVVETKDGRVGLHFLSTERPSLVILHMSLPDKRGNEVLKELRNWSKIPVIILSVENEPATVIQALDIGADDYVTKPFETDELLARVRVCLRRSVSEISTEPITRISDLEIDIEKRQVNFT